MLALISPAKRMKSQSDLTIEARYYTQPRFLDHTNFIVSMMLRYSSAELSDIFRVSASIARDLRSRFQEFYDSEESLLPAVDSYDGVVYKHFKDAVGEGDYIQQHVRISSLLYGLLRPCDMIRPYRMEGFVRVADGDERVDKFWRDIETQTLIDDVNSMGGVLLYLASKEEQNAFHWREVCRQVRVIDFKFLQYKGDKLRQVVVYTKMARGEMIRYMVEHKITWVEDMKAFEWGGYTFSNTLSKDDEWVWVMDC